MTPVTRAHRVYFAFVGAFALWVGVWGYFVPSEISRAIPWQVSPLHARFIGAMYLSGMVLMGLSLGTAIAVYGLLRRDRREGRGRRGA